MSLFARLFSLRSAAQNARSTVRQALDTADSVRQAARQAQAAAVERNYEKAEAGDVQAQYDWGERYYAGLGLPKDFTQAAVWFQKAAAQGHVEARCTLGMMYFLGRGVAHDYPEAYKWLYLAAAAGSTRAAKALDTARPRMTAEEISEGERRAAAVPRLAQVRAPEQG
jgi:TPR repeat protein